MREVCWRPFVQSLALVPQRNMSSNLEKVSLFVTQNSFDTAAASMASTGPLRPDTLRLLNPEQTEAEIEVQYSRERRGSKSCLKSTSR